MFHVEHSTFSLPDRALLEDIFGDNTDKAIAYATFVATEGIIRGLVGPREVPRMWDRHVLNSAVLESEIPKNSSVVDVGSGAGFPGIPLALARPDLSITLVEPLLRRVDFLKEITNQLELPVTVVRGRAEELDVIKAVGNADVVTSRAVAPLGKLARWSLPLVHKDGKLIALKGSSIQEEIERDKHIIKRAKGGHPIVTTVGEGILESPTNVVSITRVK